MVPWFHLRTFPALDIGVAAVPYLLRDLAGLSIGLCQVGIEPPSQKVTSIHPISLTPSVSGVAPRMVQTVGLAQLSGFSVDDSGFVDSPIERGLPIGQFRTPVSIY